MKALSNINCLLAKYDFRNFWLQFLAYCVTYHTGGIMLMLSWSFGPLIVFIPSLKNKNVSQIRVKIFGLDRSWSQIIGTMLQIAT